MKTAIYFLSEDSPTTSLRKFEPEEVAYYVTNQKDLKYLGRRVAQSLVGYRLNTDKECVVNLKKGTVSYEVITHDSDEGTTSVYVRTLYIHKSTLGTYDCTQTRIAEIDQLILKKSDHHSIHMGSMTFTLTKVGGSIDLSETESLTEINSVATSISTGRGWGDNRVGFTSELPIWVLDKVIEKLKRL